MVSGEHRSPSNRSHYEHLQIGSAEKGDTNMRAEAGRYFLILLKIDDCEPEDSCNNILLQRVLCIYHADISIVNVAMMMVMIMIRVVKISIKGPHESDYRRSLCQERHRLVLFLRRAQDYRERRIVKGQILDDEHKPGLHFQYKSPHFHMQIVLLQEYQNNR